MNRERLMGLLKRNRISPSHLLDQNFMVDSGLAGRIVSLAGIRPGETVLEIGSGIGSLTPLIARKAKRVLAVEIDRALIPLLKRACPPNVEIKEGSILKLLGGLNFDRIVSNTPYSICEPLIRKLAKTSFKRAVLTLPQGFLKALKEGPLSLFVRAFFRLEEGLEVPRQAFYPVPKTESRVLVLSHKALADYRRAPQDYVLKKLFLQDSKKLRNALRDALIDLQREILKRPGTKRQARDIIKKLSIPEETLDTLIRDLDYKALEAIKKELTSSLPGGQR